MRFGLYIEKDAETGKRAMIVKNEQMPLPEILLILEALVKRGKGTFNNSVEGDIAS